MFASHYENCGGGIVNTPPAFRQIRAAFGGQVERPEMRK
jgi:hypothetical protein